MCACPNGQTLAIFNVSNGTFFPGCGCYDEVALPVGFALRSTYGALPRQAKIAFVNSVENLLENAFGPVAAAAKKAVARATGLARQRHDWTREIAMKQAYIRDNMPALEYFRTKVQAAQARVDELMQQARALGLDTPLAVKNSTSPEAQAIWPSLRRNLERLWGNLNDRQFGGSISWYPVDQNGKPVIPQLPTHWGAKLAVMGGRIDDAEREINSLQANIRAIDNGTFDFSLLDDIRDAYFEYLMLYLSMNASQDHKCQDPSMMDDACKCTKCPQDKEICKAPNQDYFGLRVPRIGGVGVPMGDERNYCVDNCCGGQVPLWYSTNTGYGEGCRCGCRVQGSEWYPQGRIGSLQGAHWYPPGIEQSLFPCDSSVNAPGACEDGKICAPSNPPDRPTNPPSGWSSRYEWDRTSCAWKCRPGLCTGNQKASLNDSEKCKCICKDESERPPCNRPSIWVENLNGSAICECREGCCDFMLALFSGSEQARQEGLDQVYNLNVNYIQGANGITSCQTAKAVCESISNAAGQGFFLCNC